MNSIGILTGGGIGRLMAEWIVNGEPDMDVTGFNPNRFSQYQLTPAYRRERVQESLGLVYKCHYPHRDTESARGIMRSPVHARLADLGACFRDVSGWEGADWFAPAEVEPVATPLSWGRHHWFPQWEAEHRACREAVVLMDMSFMSKFLVEGVDAGRLLNRLSTANVDPDQPISGDASSGTITYTQWLTHSGKMKSDLTVTKLAPNKFMVVASDNTRGEVLGWMKRHCGDDDRVHISDVTGAYAQLNVQGPRSRELLQSATTANMSDAAFPFRSVQEIDLGFCYVKCARITYLGELGYELYVPAEFALHVYDVLREAGAPYGLQSAGLKALSSLRMEKGYRDYGHDMDNTDTLLEVGLGFTCDFEKSGGFLGRDAVMDQKAAGPLQKRLLQVLVKDPTPLLYHGETVLRDGVVVGDIRAASYGHTLGGAVGLTMIEAEEAITPKFIASGEWEVDIAGVRFPAQASLRPLYDPRNERIKC
jgi:4-methylaminobutanoate oxidase (formaldehyde-forming)